MNTTADESTLSVLASEVPEEARVHMLPRHFGRHMLTVEHAIFHFMRTLSPQYLGGYWTYYELSNGGCYMAPHAHSSFEIKVDGNDFAGTMSADAAGITACLFAYSHLSFQVKDDRLAEAFHALRDFALSHPEARHIFAAID